MPEIDHLSQMIGRIETTLDYQNKEIAKVTDGIAVIKNATDSLSKDNTTMDLTVKALHLRMDEMQPKVERHQAIVDKGKGVFWILSGAMGLVGYVLSQFIFPWLTRLLP